MTSGVLRTETREELKRLTLQHLERAPAERALLKFLFDQTAPVSSDEIADEDHSKNSVRVNVGRLRDKLEHFFLNVEEGRKQPYRISIPQTRRGYMLRFERNVADVGGTIVAEFWRPYIDSVEPVRLLYPEPQFFRYERDTYIRNPSISTVDELRERLPSLRGEMKPDTTFVPAGIVRGMLLLVETFQRLNIPVRTTPIRPFTPFDDDAADEHLVVLGTRTTNHLIATLEMRLEAQLTPDGIRFRRLQPYRDDNKEDLIGTKWALLTRRHNTLRGRVITMLSAEHGRTVQALAAALTRSEHLEPLAASLGSDGSFPDEFQTLFEVHMSPQPGEPRIDSIAPKKSHRPDRARDVRRPA